MQVLGKYFILAGIALIIIGLIIRFFAGKLSWFAHLPGDIYIERENFKFYAPLTSMILISIVISILVWIIRKF